MRDSRRGRLAETPYEAVQAKQYASALPPLGQAGTVAPAEDGAADTAGSSAVALLESPQSPGGNSTVNQEAFGATAEAAEAAERRLELMTNQLGRIALAVRIYSCIRVEPRLDI